MQLLAAAKAMVLQGNKDFSIADLCSGAQVERSVFHDHFAGKTALMAALMREYAEIEARPDAAPAQPAVAPQLVSTTDAKSEPSPTDEWYERRLRVFERALSALEEKAEARARDQAVMIADLQARLTRVRQAESIAAPVQDEAHPVSLAVCEAIADAPIACAIAPEAGIAALPDAAQNSTQAEMPLLEEMPPAVIAPIAEPVAPADEMPGTQGATAAPIDDPVTGDAVSVTHPVSELEALRSSKSKGASKRTRMMAIAAALLAGAFISVGFTLGRNALDAKAEEHAPDGVAHRQAAQTVLHKNMALADAGDTRAQARLALAYLRGQGSAADANAALLWCMSAAQAGNPVAQYLLGALYQQGDHVAADPARAVAWFSRAADKGNLKAMHNLAIAYAQGNGTTKDEAKAAEWFTRAAERGYVDSAFDLAVLYERGEGVRQDLKQALKWYGIAAFAGDQPSKERVEFLRSQMKAPDIKLATNAAMAFAPLPSLEDANNL
jgi:TPR repeat protein/AcrR family transcriptional regulator